MTVPVAVVGATGLVGQRLVARLVDHPHFDVAALTASDRHGGSAYAEAVTWRLDEPFPDAVGAVTMRETAPALAETCPLVLSALPSDVAQAVEPALAEAGAVVCSNASAFRMDPDVPLLIPEVNAEHLDVLATQRANRGWDGAIVKNPNCTSVTVTLPLAALRPFEPTAARIVTMQAVSGAGATGVAAVDAIDNVLPNIPGEAAKLETEPRKLLGAHSDDGIEHHAMDILAACHRVPVQDGHLASCFVEFADTPEPAALERALAAFEGIDLPSAPTDPIEVRADARRPQPRLDRDAGDGGAAVVGPVRPAGEGVQFECLAHNTIRGAAGACLLNAELLHARGEL